MKRVSERKLRIAMVERDYNSITSLSRASQVSRPKIYAFLASGIPYQTTFIRVADALGVPPEDLLEEESQDHA